MNLLTPKQKEELTNRQKEEKKAQIKKHNKRRNDIWESQLLKQWEML